MNSSFNYRCRLRKEISRYIRFLATCCLTFLNDHQGSLTTCWYRNLTEMLPTWFYGRDRPAEGCLYVNGGDSIFEGYVGYRMPSSVPTVYKMCSACVVISNLHTYYNCHYVHSALDFVKDIRIDRALWGTGYSSHPTKLHCLERFSTDDGKEYELAGWTSTTAMQHWRCMRARTYKHNLQRSFSIVLFFSSRITVRSIPGHHYMMGEYHCAADSSRLAWIIR